MLKFSDIQLFIRISETRGISSAAKVMGLSAAAASAAVKRLEQQVGGKLFERTTRSLRLTPSGEDFLGYCIQSTQLLEEGMTALKQGQDRLSGDIHLGAPSDLGRDYLDQILEPFRNQNPDIRIIMHLSDGIYDLYHNPIDIVLRYGVQRDSSLIARKLCETRRVICASMSYIKKYSHPKKLADLVDHNCICFYRNGEIFNNWQVSFNEKLHNVLVSGDRAADDGALVRKWALQGHGIAYKVHLDIIQDLATGRLIDLFPDLQCELIPLYAVYPSKQYQPARIKALLTFLQDEFKNTMLQINSSNTKA
jgi:DNA-binding transcriptional LysR family regulator